jgi:hypothetical protein
LETPLNNACASHDGLDGGIGFIGGKQETRKKLQLQPLVIKIEVKHL